MKFLKAAALAYLRSLHTCVRLLSAILLIGMIGALIWTFLLLSIRLPFGEASFHRLAPIVFLVLAPPLIRFGLSGAGFEIRPSPENANLPAKVPEAPIF